MPRIGSGIKRGAMWWRGSSKTHNSNGQWALQIVVEIPLLFFFSSRRRHTRFDCDWSSDVCSSDLRRFWPARPDEDALVEQEVDLEARGQAGQNLRHQLARLVHDRQSRGAAVAQDRDRKSVV